MLAKDLNTIHNIGVIGWGLLGDVLMRTAVIHALRDIFPHSKIVVSVDPIGAEVFKYNSDIDEILIFDRKKKPKWKYIYNKYRGWRDIKSSHFDLLIDLYGGESSRNLMRVSGAKYKIGFQHSNLKYKLYNLDFPKEFLPSLTPHLTKHLLKIVSVFSEAYEQYSTKPIFVTRESTDQKMEHYVASFKFQKTYLLNFGSGGAEKILSMEKSFIQVKFLYESYGYIPLVICNPGQETLQENFIQNYLIPSSIPYGALKTLTLEEVGSIMKYNNFIVTPDTGLYHMAVAIGIPILGIFTYTNPALVEPENGVYVNCFQPDSMTEHLPLSYGKKDLDYDYLIECTKNLLQYLE